MPDDALVADDEIGAQGYALIAVRILLNYIRLCRQGRRRCQAGYAAASRLAYAVLHVSQQWELEAANAALVARRFSPAQVCILAVDTAANEVTDPD